MKNNIYQFLINIQYKTSALALIDPDTKNDDILLSMINLINKCDFDIIFVGGSLISDNEFDRTLDFIKHKTNLPLVIFPGSSNQLSAHADAILYLSLIFKQILYQIIDLT